MASRVILSAYSSRDRAPSASARPKPDFSATIRLMRRPKRPWAEVSAPPWPSPLDEWPFEPAMKTRWGTSGWLLLASWSATCVRAYSLGSENDWILRSRTDASDRPTWAIRDAFALAGEGALLASAWAVTTVCSACLRERCELGLGRDDHLLGLLAGAGEVGLGGLADLGQLGLALVLGDLDLHHRVRQLRLHGRLRLGLVQGLQRLGGGPLALVGLDLLDRELAQPELLQQGLDLAAGLGRVGLADQDVDALDVELAEPRGERLARPRAGCRRGPAGAAASSACGRRRGSRPRASGRASA